MGRPSTGEEADPIVERMPWLLRFPRVWIGALAAVSLIMTACASGPTVATASAPGTVQISTTPPPVPGAGSCSRLSRATDGRHGIEVQGTTTDNEPLTMLFAGVHHRIPAKKSLTTYVRVGGVRALRISVIGTDGHVDRALGFRPGLPPFDWPGGGTPWAGTLTFPESGCWRVHVQRGGLTGEVWLRAS
jgi:hypothetical protein